MIATNNPPMPARPDKFVQRLRGHRWRGFAALALLVLVPKCVVCIAGYIGLGTLVGFGGPALCGGSNMFEATVNPAMFLSSVVPVVAALSVGIVIATRFRHHQRPRSASLTPTTNRTLLR